MHERQRLEEKRVSCDSNSPLPERHTQHHETDLDHVLFNNLVQIVPLVQSFIDREGRSSFTRQGSMVFTKKPSRKSLLKSRLDMRKGHKDKCVILKEQVEELQRKLLEKDKLIVSAENNKKLIEVLKQKLDELKHRTSEKDSLLKYTQQQLLDVKIELADKQAALEKIQWETMTSNLKVEKLQEVIDSMQGDISLFTLFLKGLTKPDTAEYADDYDIKPYDFNHQPSIDYLDEMEMQKMEEARKTYIAAVVAAKEKQDDESIATVFNARLQFQSILFKQKNFSV